MPPRTSPRRKRRSKQGAPRHFAIIRSNEIGDHPAVTSGTIIIIAHRIELDDGNLVFRDGNDAISHVLAQGEWRDVHPATMGELTVADGEPDIGNREQATLVNENDPLFQPTRKEEQDARFVPSSPEEAQRILMELERRTQDPSDAPPAPRKD